MKGQCRRYPKQIVSYVSDGFDNDLKENYISTNNFAEFPFMDNDDWCREFRATRIKFPIDKSICKNCKYFKEGK